jgi:hypothetical protein
MSPEISSSGSEHLVQKATRKFVEYRKCRRIWGRAAPLPGSSDGWRPRDGSGVTANLQVLGSFTRLSRDRSAYREDAMEAGSLSKKGEQERDGTRGLQLQAGRDGMG